MLTMSWRAVYVHNSTTSASQSAWFGKQYFAATLERAKALHLFAAIEREREIERDREREKKKKPSV